MTSAPSTEPTSGLPSVPAGLGRVITAMITPFDDQHRVDLDGVQRLAAHLVDTGTETILVNGTTAESPVLRDEEAWQVLAAVQDAVGDTAGIMMGTGANDTHRTITATARAAEAGVDAALVVTPYYNRPGQRGILAHVEAVTDAVELPVVLYDIPSRTGQEIDVDTYPHLAAIPGVVGVKDAVGNLGKAGDVAAITAEHDFVVWSGADEINLPLLSVGAAGVISVSAHLAGPEIAAMIQAFPTDPARARALHLRCMPLHRALFVEPSPTPLKAALAARGLPAGPVRLPLVPATPTTVDAVLAALTTIEAAR
ncbi:MAG: 4-hydroxy-tetrahydrodipicolinate synthase [Nitriliruptoraceae bacterium]|nr:4-hydroxy-tetrahydrodipicolinate synthase [Nitriliruptoraceae bacterium]